MMCAPNFGRFQFAPAKKSPAFSGRHRGSLEFGGRRRAAETTAAPTAAEQVGKAGEGKLGVLGEELGSGIFDGFLNVWYFDDRIPWVWCIYLRIYHKHQLK